MYNMGMNNQKYPLVRIHPDTLEILKKLGKDMKIKRLPNVIDYLVDYFINQETNIRREENK